MNFKKLYLFIAECFLTILSGVDNFVNLYLYLFNLFLYGTHVYCSYSGNLPAMFVQMRHFDFDFYCFLFVFSIELFSKWFSEPIPSHF